MDDRPWGQASFDSTRDTWLDPHATTDDSAFPWPPGPRLSTLDALGETIRRSLFEPTRFFRAMPRPSPLGAAIVYYALMSVAGAGIMLFWGSVFALLVEPDGLVAGLLGVGHSDAGSRLLGFLLSPLQSLVGLGIGALIVHAALFIFGGARNGLGATFRALAYTAATQLWVILPGIGLFVAAAWWFVVAIIGLREAHGTTTGRAAAAVIVPIVGLLALAIVLAGLAAVLSAAP
jgi:hypothetical protein